MNVRLWLLVVSLATDGTCFESSDVFWVTAKSPSRWIAR